MALTRLAINQPSATTDTLVFTAGDPYLMSVIATNLSTSTSAAIRVWVVPSVATLPAQYAYLNYDLTLDAANTFETFRVAINPGDQVYVRSSTANVSFAVYGLVQVDVKLGVGVSTYSSAEPTGPIAGMIWVDSDDNTMYVYDGASWIQLVTEQAIPEIPDPDEPFLLMGA